MDCNSVAVGLVVERQGNSGKRLRANLLTALTVLSGCCALAYEVLYVRALTTILGDMFYVHAALLSTFLAGIGLGSKVAHRWLRWLWAFEILTGLYALGLPFASGWLSQQSFMSLITSSPPLTILTTVGLIVAPSLLIGFSIPLFSAYLKACFADRLAFQGVYKAYNLGAFMSVLGVELVLIRYLGITSSLAAIGVINLFNGAVLLLMRVAPGSRPVQNRRCFPARIIIALVLASLSSAVFQMFFLKLSYLVFHPHRENFAIALSVTMLGIFIGAWLAAKVPIRFETFLLLAAVLIGLIYANYLPLLKLFEATVSWTRSSKLLILAHKFAFGCLYALGPMIVIGAILPALMRSEKEVAGESGHLLWVSSMANAAGYLVYVLIGHELLATNVLLAVIAGILLLASLIAAGFRWSRRQGVLAAGSIVLVMFMVFTWKERNFYLAHWVNELKSDDEVVVFKSGAESATLARSEKGVWLSYNGHPSVFVQIRKEINFAEMMVGIIPALNAPRLDKALVLGLGTGITAGTACRLFTSTDVVEINDAFYKMMPYLRHANLDVEHNAAANLHLSDARAFLVGKQGVYDAIINTVSAPTYFSASKIYTVQFYKRVAKALKPDGIFSMWLTAGDMSETGIQTILSALHQSFSYCELRLLRSGYYLLTCSNRPVSPRQFAELPIHQDLVNLLQSGLPGLDLGEFFDDIRLSANIFDHFQPTVAKENTDDHPVLEFMVTRHFQMKRMGGDPFIKQQALFNIDPIRGHQLGNPIRFAHRAAVFHRLGSEGGGYLDNFNPVLMKDATIASEFFWKIAEFRRHEGQLDKASSLLTTALNIRPGFAKAHNSLGSMLVSEGQLEKAIRHFTLALQSKPNLTQAYCNLGNTLALQGKHDKAIQTFKNAIEYNKQSNSMSDMASIHFSLGRILKKTNKTQEADQEFTAAVEEYRKKIAKNPESTKTLVQMGDVLVELGNLPQATEYFQQAVDMNPYDTNNQSALVQTLVSQERYDEAIVALKRAVSYTSYVGADKEAASEFERQTEFLKHKRKEKE